MTNYNQKNSERLEVLLYILIILNILILYLLINITSKVSDYRVYLGPHTVKYRATIVFRLFYK